MLALSGRQSVPGNEANGKVKEAEDKRTDEQDRRAKEQKDGTGRDRQ